MKIVIAINGPTSHYYIHHNKPIVSGAPWIESLINLLSSSISNKYYIFFPQTLDHNVIMFSYKNLDFYGIPNFVLLPTAYNFRFERTARLLFNTIKPDLLHINGTEFPHYYAVIKAFNNGSKTVVFWQGVLSEIYRNYTKKLPFLIVIRFSFYELIHLNNIFLQMLIFFIKSIYEKMIVKTSHYMIGRTSLDKKYSLSYNKNSTYIHCNELIRPIFFSHKWNQAKIINHSIFISKSNYPIKGFHVLIKAISLIIKMYPDLKVFVAGSNFISTENVNKHSYSYFIFKLLKKYKIQKNFFFLGKISEDDMLKNYLKSNIFILPSFVENSSNSLIEAMLLQMPIICSNIEGNKSFINGRNGLLFENGSYQDLASKISYFFDNEDKISTFVNNLNEFRSKYDNNHILQRYLEIYKIIYENNNDI